MTSSSLLHNIQRLQLNFCSFLFLSRTFFWQATAPSSSGTLVLLVSWTGEIVSFETDAKFLLFFPLSLNCKFAAAQRRTLMHMLGHRFMWHQKSGTTSRTTIRGVWYKIIFRFWGDENNKCSKKISLKQKNKDCTSIDHLYMA